MLIRFPYLTFTFLLSRRIDQFGMNLIKDLFEKLSLVDL